MHARLAVIAAVSVAAGLVAPDAGWLGIQAAGQPAVEVPSRALLDQYCVTCHNDRLQTAELSLDGVDVSDPAAHRDVLERVVRKLRKGQMPPEGRPRPPAYQIEQFVSRLEVSLDRVAESRSDPGRVASRRLNRAEYVSVIEDLLALEVNGEELLPSDMAGFGFDNNAEVLSITPGLMSRYIAAATKISRAAIGSPDIRPVMQLYELGYERRDVRAGEALPFATHGGLAVRHHFPLDGEYLFAIRLKRNETIETIDGIAEDEHQIELRIDHALVEQFAIGGRYPGPDPGQLIAVSEDDVEGQRLHEYRMTADHALELRVPVEAGTRLVSVSFTDAAPSPHPSPQLPGIDKVFVSGPFDGRVPEDTPSRRRIFVCQPESAVDEEPCARQILESLARRAYRRPVQTEDIDPLLGLYREGRVERDFEFGIERALEALLAMPEFLMRIEEQPVDTAPGGVYPVSDLELATRLSFFLWKSLPDEELLGLAEEGRLRESGVLAAQVARMLADERATRFMHDFAGQWLHLRNIDDQAPDGALFAGFNDSLRKAMVTETQLFFRSQVSADRPVTELLSADYTFLNEQLARHYGVDDLYGSHFRRHEWQDDRRHGLLGQASLLTVTSYANRTSVVLRGLWVLETLLGAPPPPPPPNVPPLPESDRRAPTSLRERMEQHRASPVCASCHTQMDPLGFALEHYDAIGRWRETDGGAPINATITWQGDTIDSPRAFREMLLGSGDEVVRTITEKLMTYALGRGVDQADAPAVRRIVRELAASDHRWSALVLGIVESDQFQRRRAPEAVDATAAQ
jgi:mono/diheme cytochrome c family protein